MMDPDQIIGRARERGIELSITPDLRLQVRAPKKILTPETINYLRGCRAYLIDKLCNYQFQEEVMRIIFPEDVAFVVEQVRHLDGRARLRIIRRYLEEFDAGFRAESNPARKRNAGACKANTWIRLERERGFLDA